jgi:putative DNA primase/helicase
MGNDNNAIDLEIVRREREEEAKREAERERLSAMSICPFHMTPDGLVMNVIQGKGEDATEVPIRIATKFFIIGLARDPSSNEWARWLEFHDRDGVLHRVVVRDADLHGDPGALAANLARQGLRIVTRYRRDFVEYLNLLNSDQRVTIVERTGWHTIKGKPVFVLPAETFGKPKDEHVILNTAEGSPYASRGTLADWQNGIGRLTADHRLGVLTVSTAFAGPLLDLAFQDGGGIHARGSSSIGKSALARAAASVWGPRSFMRSWRSTANGLEGAAVLSSDSCFDASSVNPLALVLPETPSCLSA